MTPTQATANRILIWMCVLESPSISSDSAPSSR